MSADSLFKWEFLTKSERKVEDAQVAEGKSGSVS